VLVSLDKAGEAMLAGAREAKARGPRRKAWRTAARPEQLRPDGCTAFILLGGRGSGKTRSAAEDCLEIVRAGRKIVHVLCPTYTDAKKTCIKGDAGSSIIECALPGEIASFNQTDLEIRFKNGSVLRGFTAEEPGRLNGPQCHHLWIDEFGLCSVESIDQALFGNRLGDVATFCGSSTPKPKPGTKQVLNLFQGATIRRMRLQDNRENLAPNFIETIERKYGGTRLGRAEIDGELLEDVEGALWQRIWIDSERLQVYPQNLIKIVIGVDPSITDPEKRKNPNKEPDSCGIVVVGLGDDSRAYVLNDLSAVLSPKQWATVAVRAFSHYRGTGIIAESNQGGQMVEDTIHGVGPTVPVQLVHAAIGKRPRAEPVSLLYEQGRVSHVGKLDLLEDELCSWDAEDPGARSPNRLDALVWAFHGLGLCNVQEARVHNRLKSNR
jgi:phage terminase large subunit-like protein